jgi:hypothetical protein
MKPIEKLKEKSLIEFTTVYSSELGHKLLPTRYPFEPIEIEREMLPLTARIKQSFFNVATLNLNEYKSKLKSIGYQT